jgi:hypothetical protein
MYGSSTKNLIIDTGVLSVAGNDILYNGVPLATSPVSNLRLNPGLISNNTYLGITETGIAGTTLAFGNLCYLSGDFRWALTDADSEITAGDVKLGVCTSGASANQSTEMLLLGKIRADSQFPTLSIGRCSYISTTLGAIQTGQPSGTDDVVRVIGYGNTAAELYFNPAGTWITRT